MTDQPSFDLGSAVMTLVIIVILMFVIIRLIPVLVQVVWQVLPGVLLLWFIVTVLRNIVNRLIG